MTAIIKKNIAMSHKFSRKAVLELETSGDYKRVENELLSARVNLNAAIKAVQRQEAEAGVRA